MKKEYDFKVNKYPVAAQVVGERFEELESEHGKITPRIVLDDSTPVDAVLHPCFEWDDVKAADRYRLVQSRELIDNLCVVRVIPNEDKSEPKTISVRAYTNISSGYKTGTFIATEKALMTEESRETVYENCKRDIRVLKNKYDAYVDFEQACLEVIAE